jgi:hypothetical protein
VRIAAAAWCGVLAGAILGIGFHLNAFVGIAIGVVAAAAVLAKPLPRSRREELELEVADGELRLSQGARRSQVPLADIRRVRVLTAVGTARRPVGWGPVFGRGLRWTWEMPDPALGVVRIDRGRGGLDLDVVTAHPDDLVRALHPLSER